MERIIIAEDDLALCNGIAIALKSTEMEIVQVHTINETVKQLKQKTDLLILDINLPDGNGLDLLKEIRRKSDLPVIMLTANDMEIDIVTGLESGANDYITKPFSLAVLRARVNTQLRSKQQITKEISNHNEVVNIDRFLFDFEHMLFKKDEQTIELSKTEQKLLRILVFNRGETIERGKLVDRIWTDGAEYVDENALSVTIKRLRDKLEDLPAKPVYIKNVYGIGYTWAVRQDD